MAYLLDADIFIQAKNLHYGMDFCPAFWDWLIKSNSKEKLFSIEKVGDELQAIEDNLSEWAKKRGANFFLKPDKSVLQSLVEVSRWVNEQDYEEGAKNVFLQKADYYLIAHAKSKKYTVVTHEKFADSKTKIKIPNVCIGLGIKCMTTYEMLRKERARFILKP
ncbi:MAG: DUF4411 family protein [Bdellovibrionales bacterium]|nr:DUF4411 family protein [Bdellovibrionales bacterium]